MFNIEIHPRIIEKLTKKHKVSKEEVQECFANVTRGFLIDTREHNQTDPQTNWFISETDRGRQLLVAFMYFSDSGKIVIKTAYEPDEKQAKTYLKLTGKG